MKKLDQFLHTLFWVAPGMFAGFALPPSPRRRLFPIKNAEADVFTSVSAFFYGPVSTASALSAGNRSAGI